MLENIHLSDTKRAAVTLRYSTKVLGQALGCRVAHGVLSEMPALVGAKQIQPADIKAFHYAGLCSGAMPMSAPQRPVLAALWMSTP